MKLFGVRLTGESIIKKSASMGNLSAAHYHSSSSAAASPNPSSPSSEPFRELPPVPDGYLSDDPARAASSSGRRADRKKGVPWSEEEHRLFLVGLQKLGKGNWRGISQNYVTSRTPTQVASHAQKYFIRQVNSRRRKRRSSLFDMVSDMATDPAALPEEQFMLPPTQALEFKTPNSLPSLELSLRPEYQPTKTTPFELIKETSTLLGEAPPVVPLFPAFLHLPLSSWPSEKVAETFHHQVLKPIPILPKEPVNVDELFGMSQLSLKENETILREPSPLSLKLLGPSARPSAFHASNPVSAPTEISRARARAM